MTQNPMLNKGQPQYLISEFQIAKSPRPGDESIRVTWGSFEGPHLSLWVSKGGDDEDDDSGQMLWMLASALMNSDQSAQPDIVKSPEAVANDNAAAEIEALKAERDEAIRRQKELAREVTGLRNSYFEERRKVVAMERNPDGCTMGMGCDEAGSCFASFHGEPDLCGKPSVSGTLQFKAVLSQLVGAIHAHGLGADIDKSENYKAMLTQAEALLAKPKSHAINRQPDDEASGPVDKTLFGRDLWELANQLEGYVDESTPPRLATFLLREGQVASDMADEILRLRQKIASKAFERLSTLATLRASTGGWSSSNKPEDRSRLVDRIVELEQAISEIGTAWDATLGQKGRFSLDTVKAMIDGFSGRLIPIYAQTMKGVGTWR